IIEAIEKNDITTARSESRAHRRERERSPLKWLEKSSYSDLRAHSLNAAADSSQDGVEPWRLTACEVFYRELQNPVSAYYEWCGGELNTDMLLYDRAGFDRLWHYEMETSAMPRAWLRGA